MPADHIALAWLALAHLRGVHACTIYHRVKHALTTPWLQMAATNELGDVYAHYGSWKEAIQAWNDALDCIIGPYQVICGANRRTCCFEAPQQCGQVRCYAELCRCLPP